MMQAVILVAWSTFFCANGLWPIRMLYMSQQHMAQISSIHQILAMVCASEYKLDHFGPLALFVSDGPEWLMERIEKFFMTIGAKTIKKKLHSVKVEIQHPDGFNAVVSTKVYPNVGGDKTIVDILRRSGDGVLFSIVYQQFTIYDFGRGAWPEFFYGGQMCPRLVLKAEPPPFEISDFRLEFCGEKRKLKDLNAASPH
eukprot:8398069-Karenia_brevis.AAC.2